MSTAVAQALQSQRALTYTPGTLMNFPGANGGTQYPQSPALNQSPMLPPQTPILAVVIAVVVILLLEHRRIRLGGRG